MDTHLRGEGLPSKQTTLVPRLPRLQQKEKSITRCAPRRDQMKLWAWKTPTGEGMDMIFPESSTLAHPLLCGQPRLVMLQRPPGGATMRWPVRLGLLSSVWAPERDRLSLLSPAALAAPEGLGASHVPSPLCA